MDRVHFGNGITNLGPSPRHNVVQNADSVDTYFGGRIVEQGNQTGYSKVYMQDEIQVEVIIRT